MPEKISSFELNGSEYIKFITKELAMDRVCVEVSYPKTNSFLLDGHVIQLITVFFLLVLVTNL